MSVAEMNKILAVDLIFLYLLFCFLETSACMSANEPLFIYLFIFGSVIYQPKMFYSRTVHTPRALQSTEY